MMTPVQFEQETRFNAALAVAKSLLSQGLIDAQEYEKIREMFVQKYRPLIGGIWPNSLDLSRG